MTLVDNIIRYENGEMTDDEILEFFQGLVNTGLAWSLQGHYGRTADALIGEGYIYTNQGGVDEDGHSG